MKIVNQNTILQTGDLCVPQGWSGELNNSYPILDDNNPFNVFTSTGKPLKQIALMVHWIWRPYVDFVQVLSDSPIQIGDVIIHCSAYDTIDARNVINKSIIELISEHKKACVCLSKQFLGKQMKNYVNQANYILFRRVPKFSDTIICDDSIPLMLDDIITSDNFVGDPFQIVNQLPIHYLAGQENGIVNKTPDVVSISSCRSIFKLKNNIVAWRRQKVGESILIKKSIRRAPSTGNQKYSEPLPIP